VSLPELSRIRSILGSDTLFVVVQDLYLTETAAFADVVLRRPPGVRRPASSPMPTAPSTCPSRP
jgi:predicted molibdopterin-dependent oxidoreductase YjgC